MCVYLGVSPLMCVRVSVEINFLSTTHFRHSSVPSAVACFCSSSPLLFLHLPLLVLFRPRAYGAPPSLSLCRAPPWCLRDAAGSEGGGIPVPDSAGRCFRGESAPSRPRTSAGFRCSGAKIRTRRREDGRPWGSRRWDGRWRQSSGNRAPRPGSGRLHRETAQPDELKCPAR